MADISLSELRHRVEDRARAFFEDELGDEPFHMRDAAERLAAMLTSDGDGIGRDMARLQAYSALRGVVKEVVNGYPRALWLGRGRWFQRFEAVPAAVHLTRAQQDGPKVDGQLRHIAMHLRAAREKGEVVESFATDRRESMLRALEESLS